MAGKNTNIAVKHVVLFQLDFGSVGFDGAAMQHDDCGLIAGGQVDGGVVKNCLQILT